MGPHAPTDYPRSFWASRPFGLPLTARDFLDKNDIRFLPTPGASYQDSSFTSWLCLRVPSVLPSRVGLLHYRRDNENSSVNLRARSTTRVCVTSMPRRSFLDEVRPTSAGSGFCSAPTPSSSTIAGIHDRSATSSRASSSTASGTRCARRLPVARLPGYLDGSIWDDEQTRGFLYSSPGRSRRSRRSSRILSSTPSTVPARRALGKKETISATGCRRRQRRCPACYSASSRR